MWVGRVSHVPRAAIFNLYLASLKNPAENATREKPLEINLDGREFRLWTESAGVSFGGQARISNAHWVINVGGASHLGWDSHVDETEDDVRRQLEAWWREKKAGA